MAASKRNSDAKQTSAPPKSNSHMHWDFEAAATRQASICARRSPLHGSASAAGDQIVHQPWSSPGSTSLSVPERVSGAVRLRRGRFTLAGTAEAKSVHRVGRRGQDTGRRDAHSPPPPNFACSGDCNPPPAGPGASCAQPCPGRKPPTPRPAHGTAPRCQTTPRVHGRLGQRPGGTRQPTERPTGPRDTSGADLKRGAASAGVQRHRVVRRPVRAALQRAEVVEGQAARPRRA